MEYGLPASGSCKMHVLSSEFERRVKDVSFFSVES